MTRLTPSLDWEDDAQELLDNVAYDIFELEYFDLELEQRLYVLERVGVILDDNATSSQE